MNNVLVRAAGAGVAVPIVGSPARRLPDDRVRTGDLLEATARSTR